MIDFLAAATGSYTSYINIEYSDGKLRIVTLPEFENYEWKETETQMALRLNFVCSGETRGVTFIQNIAAANNFEPEFSASEYEIILPTPLFAGFDITLLLKVRRHKNLVE